MEQHDRPWLKVTEAADTAGVSPSALRIMLKRGEIPYRRFGRLIRIHKDALASATAGSTAGSAQGITR